MINNKEVNVFIAEDDYLVSEEIKRCLKKTGFCKLIGEAVDGVETVEKVCDLQPDVVLMGIQMPKLNGLDATLQIQERCPTPVIILTAHDSRNLVYKAIETGVSAYLTKPPEPTEIERAISIAIARHSDLMESKRLNNELQKEINERKKVQNILANEKEHLSTTLRSIGDG